MLKYITPLLLILPLASEPIERLDGGASNHNYRINANGESYLLRIAEGDTALPDRSLDNEVQVMQIADHYGLVPSIVLYLSHSQLLITQFIPGAKPDLHDRNTLDRAVTTIRTLHAITDTFPTTTDPQDTLRLYRKTACDRHIILPDSLTTLVDRLTGMTPMPYSPTPCHLDLHAGNLIDSGDTLWLIDWEFAALSDPLFDLATLASTEQFTDGEMETLLTLYLERPPLPDETTHITLMRVIADVRWALWCLIQEANSPLDYPYRAMGEGYLAEALIRSQIINFE